MSSLDQDEKRFDPLDTTLSFVDRPDDLEPAFSDDDEDQGLRAEMSCGHAVTPQSLTGWCRSLLDQGQYKFRCPAVDEDTQEICGAVWPYKEVRRLADLSRMGTNYWVFVHGLGGETLTVDLCNTEEEMQRLTVGQLKEKIFEKLLYAADEGQSVNKERKYTSCVQASGWKETHHCCLNMESNTRPQYTCIVVVVGEEPPIPPTLIQMMGSVIRRGKTRFVCGQSGCDAEWPYQEVCKMAMLTPEEMKNFETTMAQNAATIDPNAKF
ncbi:hypothetical protein CCH79_00012894, partial [Gambusia affinis]